MKGRVLVVIGMSEELCINISLRQGSILSPLMFITVMELVSMKDTQEATACRRPGDSSGEQAGDARSAGGVEVGVREA